MILHNISQSEYEKMMESQLCSLKDMYKLASYPYVSLLSLYKNLSNYEYRKIREIEDDNIATFFRVVSALFGIGSRDEVNAINRIMNEEPLRSAVIAARQESNPSNRIPKYIELACKILLSIEKEGTNRFNAINVKISGKIPALPFSNRQEIADEWYNHFVDLKLNGMKKVYQDLGPDIAYTFLVSSILQSLYHFAPSRYNIDTCLSDDEALHKVLEIFTNINSN